MKNRRLFKKIVATVAMLALATGIAECKYSSYTKEGEKCTVANALTGQKIEFRVETEGKHTLYIDNVEACNTAK